MEQIIPTAIIGVITLGFWVWFVVDIIRRERKTRK